MTQFSKGRIGLHIIVWATLIHVPKYCATGAEPVASGVLLEKEQAFFPDSKAKPVEYFQMVTHQSIIHLTLPNMVQRRVLPGNFVMNFDYYSDDTFSSVASDYEAAQLKQYLLTYREAVRSWPQLGKFLAPSLRSMERDMKLYEEGGMVKVNGAWKSLKEIKEEAERMRALEAERMKAEEQKRSAEKLAAEKARIEREEREAREAEAAAELREREELIAKQQAEAERVRQAAETQRLEAEQREKEKLDSLGL